MAARRRKTFEVTNLDEKKTRQTIGREEPGTFLWENAKPDDAHAAFTRWADHVRNRPASIDRRKKNLLFASLYSNLPLLGFGVNQYTRNMPQQGQISLNATQNAIDSLVAKVCKNRPRPMFTTVEGDYELQEQAENADQYVDGKFYEMSYYSEIYPGKVLDSCIYGLGATKIHEVNGDAVIERRYPWEFIVDDRECMYGTPVRIGERKYFDKQECFDLYRREGNGKVDKEWNHTLEQAIDSRASDVDMQDFDRDESSEQIPVYEGYVRKRPRGPGRKIVCIRGKTLRFEDYTDPKLPYSFLRPGPQTMGFWGIGMCERVAGLQREINRLIRSIQMAMHLVAKPHWMVEASSQVNTSSLNNDIGTIIKYSGAVKPEVYAPQSMSAEVFAHLQYLVKTLYEVMGVSQLSAQSQKPAGLNSGVGLRTYLNTETERFSKFIENAEESASEDAFQLARVLGGIRKPKKMLARSTAEGRIVPRVTWDKLDFDTISVQIYPTSKLPDTPAGRREYALELAQYTRVTTDDIFEMLEWDDTEAFARRRLAGKKNVERDIAHMRRGDKVIRDAIGDHRMAFDMVSDAYEEARHDNLPENRLATMRNYIKACYRYLTGKAWVDQGPNPMPGESAPAGPANGLGPPPPGPGAPQPMLPPGAPPPPPLPMANGGLPAPMPPPQGP